METPTNDRLGSWKAIAAYVRRDVTTVQRWEKREGMPIHRHVHDKRGSVYAFRSELDAWVRDRRPPPEEQQEESPARRPWKVLVAVAIALVGALALWLFMSSGPASGEPLAGARVTPLTDFDGRELAASISRDGKFVAFLADRDGVMDAWVTQIGTGQFMNLTHGAAPELMNSQQSQGAPRAQSLRRNQDSSSTGRRAGDSSCCSLSSRQRSRARASSSDRKAWTRGPLVFEVTVDRHALAELYPALHRGHVAPDIGGDGLPQDQTIVGLRSSIALTGLVERDCKRRHAASRGILLLEASTRPSQTSGQIPAIRAARKCIFMKRKYSPWTTVLAAVGLRRRAELTVCHARGDSRRPKVDTSNGRDPGGRVAACGLTPPRNYAMVHIAMFDAMNSIEVRTGRID